MREMIESRRRGFGKGAVLAALTALLVGLGAYGMAQTDTDERILQLEASVEEIKAEIREGKDVQTKLAALEQALAELKEEVAAQGQGGQTEEEKAAPEKTATSPAPAPTPPPLPPAGVQGAPNPLQDDKRYLTGQDLLDESFPNSLPIPGTQTRFAVGGYAKLDFIHDLDFVGDRIWPPRLGSSDRLRPPRPSGLLMSFFGSSTPSDQVTCFPMRSCQRTCATRSP